MKLHENKKVSFKIYKTEEKKCAKKLLQDVWMKILKTVLTLEAQIFKSLLFVIFYEWLEGLLQS